MLNQMLDQLVAWSGALNFCLGKSTRPITN